MDIAAMSTQLSTVKLQNTVGLVMMKKSMDQQQVNMENMVEMMEAAVPPSEHIIDIRV